MNQSLKKVVDFYKPIAQLTHKQEVMRSYRKSLRLLMSWAENRELFNEEALKIRSEFNLNYDATPGIF